MQEEVEGYVIPLHRSLTEPVLMANAPRSIVILNGTLLATMFIALHSLLIIPFCVIIHLVSVYLTKKDPQFFDCYKRYIRTKNYYST